MRNLDQLSRKCRFQPQMGGNREHITLPCTLVGRLIDMAQAWERLETGRDLIPVLNSMDQELVWADDEAKACLERGVKVCREPV